MSRLRRIFLPYLLAVTIYYLYFVRHGYFPFSLKDLVGYAVRGDLSAPFYFIVALAQFVLLVPLFRWLVRRWSPFLLLPAALGITMLSGQYCSHILRLLSPTLNFPYSDRIFTTYLVYYLAGCYAGAHYKDFIHMLRNNIPPLAVLSLTLAAADVACSWQFFVCGESVPFLEPLHTLYQLFAIPALYVLALHLPASLPPLLQKMDRASFLVYLYHSLIIAVFNDWAVRLGISKVSVQFVLRVLVVYTLTFTLCILWQWGAGKIRTAPPQPGERP